jgi:phospholipase C
VKPLVFAVAALILAACNGATSQAVQSEPAVRPQSGSPSSPISHIVLIVQENRTFNNLFATFPGTVGTTTGKELVGGEVESINLTKEPLESPRTLRHTYAGYKTAYHGGKMDAFNLIRFEANGHDEGALPYEYVDPTDVAPYWAIATDYAVADHMFTTQGSSSFPAHQDLIRGGTAIDSTESLIDDPNKSPWGCPAPPGTTTDLITTRLKYESHRGPSPCTSDFPPSGSYETLQVLLDAQSVSWKYYTPPYEGNNATNWNAFLVIASVFNNKTEWNAHISQPETNVFADISNGALPSVSWVIPDGVNSDHPGYKSDTGPSWVASVVNAVGESSYWKSTAIVIVWDDWGGFYDEVKPPKLDNQGGPGFRVPMLIVSPYVGQNEISHETFEFGSIIRFIEDNWNLGRLGTTDETTKSIASMFDFNQSPRSFITIPSSRSKSFFLHQKPSGLPVDDE